MDLYVCIRREPITETVEQWDDDAGDYEEVEVTRISPMPVAFFTPVRAFDPSDVLARIASELGIPQRQLCLHGGLPIFDNA